MSSLIKTIDSINPLRILHGEERDEMILSLATLVRSLMLVCYIITGPLLKQFHVKIIRPLWSYYDSRNNFNFINKDGKSRIFLF